MYYENLSSRNTTATITEVSSQVLPQNPTRQVLVIRNSSTNGSTITVHMGSQVAVLGSGVLLAVAQSLSDADNAGYMCWRGEIQAISSVVGAGSVLSIFER
jgi:hypothetical protein